jgi:nucleotide-binding universal stress UspA family protein
MNKIDKYSRMLVGLDLTDMDQHVVKFACMIARMFKVDAVYFLHVTSSLELPEDIAEKYGDMMAPVDETLEKEMEETMKKCFSTIENCSIEVEAHAGDVTEEVIKWAKVKRVDLIVLGRKSSLTGTGLHSRKIARTSSASVIFVPENPPAKINKILVPIDYSKYSQMAFELSADIQKETGAKLYSNHVYKVPTGYYKAGKTYEEFAEIMLENTKKESRKFFNKIGADEIDFDFTYALDDDIHPADKIYKTASEQGVDMILLGSKGRSTAAAMLIGSVAEKLLQESHDIPIFLVKKGNENLSLIEALFRV